MRTRCKSRKSGIDWLAMLLTTALTLLITVTGQAPDASAKQPNFCKGSSVDVLRAGVIGPSVAGISVALYARRVEPGQSLYARLINRGEDRATYGPQHRIERYSDSQWMVDPASPHGPWHKIFWLLPPDAAGRCFQFAVPVDQPAGIYKFVIPVKGDRGRSGRTALFRVE